MNFLAFFVLTCFGGQCHSSSMIHDQEFYHRKQSRVWNAPICSKILVDRMGL